MERNSRKRSAPARLREELWYLVKYEDDENLRVLAEEEVRHIFPDEEEGNEMQVGDIISALWIPNGKYYDAKILNKGADRNELMKERMRLEKEKKNGNKGQEPKAQKKRKHPEEDKENQKKKKKESTESAKEKEQAVQNKEEKRKKKEQEQERQKMMLEARKAQAISRWVASTTATTHNDEVTIINDSPSVTFTPQPLRQANSSNQSPMTPAHIAYTSDRTPSTTPESMRSTIQESSVASLTVPGSSAGTKSSTRTPNTSAISTPGSVQSKQSSSAANPRPAGTKTKGTREPKRGLHFQSAIADNSDDEIQEEEEGEQILEDADASSSDCCKEQRMEIKALRKRLEKVHKRLNIALKSKTSAEVINNRPGAGVVDSTLAAEYKMVEVMEGSSVFWYPHQRAYCSAFKSWPGYVNAAVDIFFTKETLAISSARGNDRKGKNGDANIPLTPLIIDALIGKVSSKFSKDSPLRSQIIQKINMKCVEARRPPRVREQRAE